ncbi:MULTISPECIES: RHS domain-containing protein [unclassified Massilia]|uniref:RHS domain-containing protein n=1 Tax=unclassified Massilia TaxID=2609279 RepID=UPI0009EC702F
MDAVAGREGAARAELRHLHTDRLGTPREMTDAGGRVEWAAHYRLPVMCSRLCRKRTRRGTFGQGQHNHVEEPVQARPGGQGCG